MTTVDPVVHDAPGEIVAAAGDAIITIDRQARITGWNPSAERLFGWSQEEVAGRQVDVIAGEERRSELMSLVVPKVLAGETVATYDTVRRRKDGSTFDASVTAFPLRDADGEVIGAASITRDGPCSIPSATSWSCAQSSAREAEAPPRSRSAPALPAGWRRFAGRSSLKTPRPSTSLTRRCAGMLAR